MKDFLCGLSLIKLRKMIEKICKQEVEIGKQIFSAQFKVLLLLYENANISPTTLVDELQIAKSNIANICKELESKGEIEHTISEDDHRIIYYHLTKIGEKNVALQLKKLSNLIESRLDNSLQEELQMYLKRSLEILEQIGEEKDVGDN